MPEAVKRLVSTDDIKLIGVVISILLTGFMLWSETQADIVELEVRSEIESRGNKEQLLAIKELTKAVQELTISNVQLEARLHSLEREK